jgi:arsenate reductase
MTDPLARRALAEGLGTALLVTTVIGSGIAATRLSGDVGLQLLENAVVTGAALLALILALGSVSGAHFNPVVTLADRLFRGLGTGDAAAYIAAQFAGGAAGAVVANLMFDLPGVTVSTHARTGGGVLLGEVVATFGLLLVIFGVVRSGRASAAPFAVGGYLTAAYWFTSSTSFANPAVTVARTLSNSFAGIAPSSVAAFVAMQLAGALLAVAAVRALYPDIAAVADRVVVPHEAGGNAAAKGIIVKDRPEVLFVCVHNAGRSQMAAALLDHHAAGRVVVRSAGSRPADQLNPAVVAAMDELGLDLGQAFPKPLTTDAVKASDVVITMGCGDACPIFPGKHYLDWELEDPAGKDVDTVRRIRDDIDARVRALLTELVPSPA